MSDSENCNRWRQFQMGAKQCTTIIFRCFVHRFLTYPDDRSFRCSWCIYIWGIQRPIGYKEKWTLRFIHLQLNQHFSLLMEWCQTDLLPVQGVFGKSLQYSGSDWKQPEYFSLFDFRTETICILEKSYWIIQISYATVVPNMPHKQTSHRTVVTLGISTCRAFIAVYGVSHMWSNRMSSGCEIV